MKKKFKLTNLKIDSFVTQFKGSKMNTIQGGGYSAAPGCAYGSLKCSGDGGYQNSQEYGCSDAGGCSGRHWCN
ncbi:MAG: pinensin family lanthipeptide [Bacteroidota bacterium]